LPISKARPENLPQQARQGNATDRSANLAYRLDGGENQSGSGRLALAIRQALAAGTPAEATFLLQQLAADPNFAN
jgi:hypothetical protein